MVRLLENAPDLRRSEVGHRACEGHLVGIEGVAEEDTDACDTSKQSPVETVERRSLLTFPPIRPGVALR